MSDVVGMPLELGEIVQIYVVVCPDLFWSAFLCKIDWKKGSVVSIAVSISKYILW